MQQPTSLLQVKPTLTLRLSRAPANLAPRPLRQRGRLHRHDDDDSSATTVRWRTGVEGLWQCVYAHLLDARDVLYAPVRAAVRVSQRFADATRGQVYRADRLSC